MLTSRQQKERSGERRACWRRTQHEEQQHDQEQEKLLLEQWQPLQEEEEEEQEEHGQQQEEQLPLSSSSSSSQWRGRLRRVQVIIIKGSCHVCSNHSYHRAFLNFISVQHPSCRRGLFLKNICQFYLAGRWRCPSVTAVPASFSSPHAHQRSGGARETCSYTASRAPTHDRAATARAAAPPQPRSAVISAGPSPAALELALTLLTAMVTACAAESYCSLPRCRRHRPLGFARSRSS